MGIGATLCHVLREDTVHTNAMPQREFRAGVGGSHKRAGGVRYVVIGGGGSSSSSGSGSSSGGSGGGGGGSGGGSSAAAEAVYIEKMQQQAERLRAQLSEGERLSAALQEKTHASVRYRLQYATAAKRLEQRDVENRRLQTELDAAYTQLEQQRCASSEAHAILKELAGVVTAVLDDLPNLEHEICAIGSPNTAPAYGSANSDLGDGEDALRTARTPRQLAPTTALPSLRAGLSAALLSAVRLLREHELTTTPTTALERPHPNSPVGSARQAALSSPGCSSAGEAPKTAPSLSSRRGFASRAASLAREPGAPGAQDGASSSSATAMLADVTGGARDGASAVVSTTDAQPAAPPLHHLKSGAAAPSQNRGATGTTGTTGAAAGAPGAAASAPAMREAVCEVGVQAGGYRVPYPSVAAAPLSGEETTRPLSRASALVRRAHSSTQTSTLGVGTARSRLETFAAQTQTEESFLDGMAVTRPPRMAAGVYGAPHPSAVLSDAATAELILEALDAARYGAPSQHEFVCNGSSAVAQKQTPVPSTQPSTRPSTAASRPSRPSTAGGGRVYPSSLSAGVAASTMYAALPRSTSSPTCRPVSATPTSMASAQSSTTSTAGPIAMAVAIAAAGGAGARHGAGRAEGASLRTALRELPLGA